MSPDEVCRDDLMWLAGWLEGEGSFTYSVRQDRYNCVRLSSSCTDYDIVARAKELLGAYSITTIYPKNGSHKVLYIVAISGVQAANWMKKLYPYMGIRRKEQITEALSNGYIHPRKPRLTMLQIEEIRQLYRGDTTISQRELARRFGVGQSTIGRIVSNQAYTKG